MSRKSSLRRGLCHNAARAASGRATFEFALLHARRPAAALRRSTRD